MLRNLLCEEDGGVRLTMPDNRNLPRRGQNTRTDAARVENASRVRGNVNKNRILGPKRGHDFATRNGHKMAVENDGGWVLGLGY